jgi:pilus assembly protein CpaE
MKTNLTLIVLSRDEADAKELGRAVAAYGGVRLLMSSGDPAQVSSEVARLRPSAVVVVLPAAADESLKFAHNLAAEHPSTAVICASRDSSPDLILRSMRAGARDFLRLPVGGEDLKVVLERTAEFAAEHAAEGPQKRGRVVSVFSSKGGCGCSLIATNVALACGAPTALFDLNLQSGDLELFLGLRPKFSFADVVENRARLDDALLASYMTPRSKDLSLLAAPPEAALSEDIQPLHVHEAIERLRSAYDFVVIDTPHNFDSITLSALDNSDVVLVVLTLEIHAIRSTRRALEIFDRLGYPRSKVRLVVNRWSKHIELDQRQIERFLGERVAGYVQSDYRTAVNSINLGQPLLESAPNSKVAADIRRVAAAVLGGAEESAPEPAEARRRPLSLFRRQAAEENFGLGAALDRATLDKV